MTFRTMKCSVLRERLTISYDPNVNPSADPTAYPKADHDDDPNRLLHQNFIEIMPQTRPPRRVGIYGENQPYVQA